MKRILIEGMSGNLGGMETFVRNLYGLLKDDWQVDFITVDPKIPFEEEFLAGGSRIHRITPRWRSVLRFRRDLDQVFAEGHYDVFWSNKTTLSSVDSLVSARKHGVSRVILHSHASRNMGNFLTGILHRLHRRTIGRYADVKAACSQEAAIWFFGGNAGDVIRIPNAVDADIYAPDPDLAMQAKQALGVENKFVVGNAARFSPEKNHRQLLDIFEALHRKQPDSHLLLCGTGALLEQMKQLTKEKGLEEAVSFLGSRDDMPFVYQAMDVFLLPSLFEGLPFTLVEAQAAGIPCVVSDAVSREAALTELVEYLPLTASGEEWADRILRYEGHRKVSRREQLTARGFTREALAETVAKILSGER